MLQKFTLIKKYINLFVFYCIAIAILLSPIIVLITGFLVLQGDKKVIEFPNQTVLSDIPAFQEIKVYSIDFNGHSYLLFSADAQESKLNDKQVITGIVHSPTCMAESCVKHRNSCSQRALYLR